MVTKAARKDAARGQRQSPAKDTGSDTTPHFGHLRYCYVRYGRDVGSTEAEGGQLLKTTGFAGSHD
jgi:hypothetical protein